MVWSKVEDPIGISVNYPLGSNSCNQNQDYAGGKGFSLPPVVSKRTLDGLCLCCLAAAGAAASWAFCVQGFRLLGRRRQLRAQTGPTCSWEPPPPNYLRHSVEMQACLFRSLFRPNKVAWLPASQFNTQIGQPVFVHQASWGESDSAWRCQSTFLFVGVQRNLLLFFGGRGSEREIIKGGLQILPLSQFSLSLSPLPFSDSLWLPSCTSHAHTKCATKLGHALLSI